MITPRHYRVALRVVSNRKRLRGLPGFHDSIVEARRHFSTTDAQAKQPGPWASSATYQAW